jgi:hypothetical protein
MPFADRFTEVYEQVYRPCCHSLDVRCWRVDEVAGPGSITTDIINGVLDSTFLIADLTTQNPNVFYELGIAHTLGKEVILTCQSVEDVPFDIRSSRVIIYDQTISGAAKLRHALARAIESVLQGSEAASNPVQDAIRLRNLADNRLLHEQRIGGRLIQPNSAQVAAPPAEGLGARIEAARLDNALAKLHAALEQIVDPKKDEDKVLILVEGRKALYAQFAADKLGKYVFGETVSNEYLAGHEKLSQQQEEHLKSEGWVAPDKDFMNFHREWEVRDSHDLRMMALEVIRALTDVYNVHNLDRLMISVFE